jgi:hypothetical protein
MYLKLIIIEVNRLKLTFSIYQPIKSNHLVRKRELMICLDLYETIRLLLLTSKVILVSYIIDINQIRN